MDDIQGPLHMEEVDGLVSEIGEQIVEEAEDNRQQQAVVDGNEGLERDEARLQTSILDTVIVLDSQAPQNSSPVTNADYNDAERHNGRGDRTKTIAACLGFMLNFVSISLAQFIPSLNVIHGGNLASGVDTATKFHLKRRRQMMSNRNWTQVMYYVSMQIFFLTLPREILGDWYIKPRSLQWFLLYIDWMPDNDPERFKYFFRISPRLFQHICEMVHDDLLRDPPSALRVLPNRVLLVKRQVALAIRRLATGDQFLGIAELFGLGKTTAINATWNFIKALLKNGHRHLCWPDVQRQQIIKGQFAHRWGFPNCLGAVDGTHFTVELPLGEDSTHYYDYKRNVSVSMQAVVDLELRFLNVVAGWPGSIQDARLMQKSKFFHKVCYSEDRLNGEAFRARDGGLIREYILADAGYALYDWLIVPYTRGLSPAKDEFNNRHSGCRMCVERAFGRLKGTWKVLSRILYKPKVERIGPLIYACCILHNLIIDRNDNLNPAIYADMTGYPTGYGRVSIPTRAYHGGGREARDSIMREVLRRNNRR